VRWGSQLYVEECVELLLRGGAAPTVNVANSEGVTSLMLISSVAVAQLLLDAGADILAEDDEGETALDHALLRHESPVPIQLLEAAEERAYLKMPALELIQ
jgi:ankyrin repeat protein